jgi:5'-nucleotidase (lipoprotein e(P4) family)
MTTSFSRLPGAYAAAGFFFALFALSAQAAEAPKVARFSSALNWVTQSREYKAVCLQTYANAWEKVAAAAQKESGPWAIVMDLDETVLDNSGYQRHLEARGEAFSQESWEEWVLKKEAALVPGTKEFISKVRALPRARIIFISNRYARNTNPTRVNLQKLGLAGDNDIYLLRKEKVDTKTIRQKEVLKGTGRMVKHGAFKVLAWFGDAAHDVPDDPKLKWGTHKFMLPNPVYGNWDK